MSRQRQLRWRIGMTAMVAAFVWALLGWEHLHGGVVTHNILARDDMPGISNLWGGLVLPALAWFLLGRIQWRSMRDALGAHGKSAAVARPGPGIAGFAGAVVFGVLLSAFFMAGRENLTSHMATALLPLALLFPIYRAEYVLGFVLAMTFTFGAILPTVFACVVALVAVALYRYVRPLLIGCASWLRQTVGRRLRVRGQAPVK